MRKPSEKGRGDKKAPSERRDKPAGKPNRGEGKSSSSGFRPREEREGPGEKKKRVGFDKKSGPDKERRFSKERPAGRKDGNNRYSKSEGSERRSTRPFEKKGKEDNGKSFSRPGLPEKNDAFTKKSFSGKTLRGPRKSDEATENSAERKRPGSFDKRGNEGGKKSFGKSGFSPKNDKFTKKTFGGKTLKGPGKSDDTREGGFRESRPRREKSVRTPQVSKHQDGTIRLNRFLSNAGLASRREADVMIEAGLVKVNGKIITELGTRVNPEIDEIQYGGERIKSEKKVYILVNKPKNIITTTDDPEGRNTVMELIRDFPGKERVFPVGRLDRNTTGVLLLTNDGDLSNKLTHPRYGVKKVYIVTIDKPLKPADRHRLLEGVELEDGMVQADAVEHKDEKDKATLFFEIHSGKNRIVRRMFESIGYEVVKLDRTLFGGLSKTGLRRGQWRILEETEIQKLKKL